MLFKAVQKYCVDTLCIFAVFLFTTNVLAHGGATIENDRCVFRSQGYSIHFTAYQPSFSRTKELCRAVNSLSETIIVLDFVDEALRKLPVDLILKKQKDDQLYADYMLVDERIYPAGTMQLPMKKIEQGVYRLYVNIQEPAHQHEVAENVHQIAGFFEFTVTDGAKEKEQSFLARSTWLFYLLALGVFIYLMALKYRS